MISCWVRGLSDRDIEAMLGEVFGEQAKVSKATASRICQRLRAEFDAWDKRDLSGVKVDYLYLDGSYFKMHPKAKAEPVLAAWGIDTDGLAGVMDLYSRRIVGWAMDTNLDTQLVLAAWGIDTDGHAVFLGLGPGASESAGAWGSFVDDMKDRGLRSPLLVISDGGKGLCAAIETCFPDSLHQRCLVHVCRNLVEKVPLHAQGEVKRDYWAIFDGIEAEGKAAEAEARKRAKRFIARWEPLHPSAVACVADNLDALVAHLRFPKEHHKRIRHSNLIERTFGETRRRVKVIGRLPGEQSCLSLIWAVLDRASKGWRGLTMTPKILRQLQDLRRDLLGGRPGRQQAEDLVAGTVTAAA